MTPATISPTATMSEGAARVLRWLERHDQDLRRPVTGNLVARIAADLCMSEGSVWRRIEELRNLLPPKLVAQVASRMREANTEYAERNTEYAERKTEALAPEENPPMTETAPRVKKPENLSPRQEQLWEELVRRNLHPLAKVSYAVANEIGAGWEVGYASIYTAHHGILSKLGVREPLPPGTPWDEPAMSESQEPAPAEAAPSSTPETDPLAELGFVPEEEGECVPSVPGEPAPESERCDVCGNKKSSCYLMACPTTVKTAPPNDPLHEARSTLCALLEGEDGLDEARPWLTMVRVVGELRRDRERLAEECERAHELIDENCVALNLDGPERPPLEERLRRVFAAWTRAEASREELRRERETTIQQVERLEKEISCLSEELRRFCVDAEQAQNAQTLAERSYSEERQQRELAERQLADLQHRYQKAIGDREEAWRALEEAKTQSPEPGANGYWSAAAPRYWPAGTPVSDLPQLSASDVERAMKVALGETVAHGGLARRQRLLRAALHFVDQALEMAEPERVEVAA